MLRATASHPTMFLRTSLDVVDRFLNKLEKLVIGFTACVIIVVMFIVAADALGRYFFNKPLFFTVDLVSHYLLPIMMLMSAGLVLRRAKHISVDLFVSIMPPRLFQALSGLALAATLVVLGIMTYRLGITAMDSFEHGKVAAGIIPWPLWIEHTVYAVCMGLLALRTCHMAVSNLAAAVTGQPDLGISLIHTHESPLEESI